MTMVKLLKRADRIISEQERENMDWLKMVSRAHERDRVFYEKIALRAINDHIEGLYPGYKPKGDRPMSEKDKGSATGRVRYGQKGPLLGEDQVKVETFENKSNDSARHFLSSMYPKAKVEVECYFGETAKGGVDISVLDKTGVNDGVISLDGRFLRTVANILLEQADRYENVTTFIFTSDGGFRVPKSDPAEMSEIPDHKFPGLASFREREGLETLIVEEDPDSINEGAVKSKFRFYRSPEDKQEENYFAEVFFCKDGDVIYRDCQTVSQYEVLIPKRFVGPFITLLQRKTYPEALPFTATALNLLQQPENKADLEGQKLKALTELTKSYLAGLRDGEVPEGELIRTMIVFRQQVGLPLIEPDIGHFKASAEKDGHT